MLPLDSVLINHYGLSYTYSDDTKPLIDEFQSLVRKVQLANSKGEKLPKSDYKRLDEIRRKHDLVFYVYHDPLYQDFRDLMEEEKYMYLYREPKTMTAQEKKERYEKAKEVLEKIKQKKETHYGE